MPELPEVETVRRGLAPAMEGARIERLELNRPDLRFPLPEDFAVWSAHETKPHPSPTYVRTPDMEGSQSQLKTRGRLKILSS